jgi:hypothetical protein
MPHTILQQRQRRCCRCNGCDTIGIAIGEFVDKHPYVSFLVFLGIMFALMALVGLNDAGDRVSALGGM